MDKPARRIVITGGGTAGWMTAAALARYLAPGSPGSAWQVTLIESDAIGTVGVGEATIPPITLFNAGLGIDEAAFLAATHGSYKLGIEFAGWGAPDARYMHAFGPVGRPLGLLGFHHYWRRAQAAGKAGPLDDYVMNGVAARAGRYAPAGAGAGAGGGGAPDLVAAYHFDAGEYAAFLRTYAEAGGVVRAEGRIAGAVRDGASGDVTALVMDNGDQHAADLFVDCSGFSSLLLGRELATPFIDWSHWLPCDRAWAVPCGRADPLLPYTRATARRAGWQWRIPLTHRTGNGHVFCSGAMAEDEAAALLLANLDAPALGDPRLIRFQTGRRAQFWAHNVVGIGLSGGFLEPLESTSIHLIQSGIARLLQYLPAGPVPDADRAAFNQAMAAEFDQIRDFIILHYHANGRVGEAFWDQLRAMPLPDMLRAKLDLFATRGIVPRSGDELFTEAAWVQVLIGQGHAPAGWHPLADAVSEADLAMVMHATRSGYARAAAQMPEHGAVLARLNSGAAQQRMAQ